MTNCPECQPSTLTIHGEKILRDEIKSLRTEVSRYKWISVDDDLPGLHQDVLTVNEYDSINGHTGIHMVADSRMSDGNWEIGADRVTHWRPLDWPESSVSGSQVQDCPNSGCDNQGWYADYDPRTGEAEQVQCEWCYTHPDSRFNANLKAVSVSGSPEPTSCEWFDDDDGWHSGCGQWWEFTYDGPKENGVAFCMYCSKPVTIAEFVDDSQKTPLSDRLEQRGFTKKLDRVCGSPYCDKRFSTRDPMQMYCSVGCHPPGPPDPPPGGPMPRWGDDTEQPKPFRNTTADDGRESSK